MKNVCSTFEHYVLNHNVLLSYIITMDFGWNLDHTLHLHLLFNDY